MVVTRTRPSGSATSVCRPLSSTVARVLLRCEAGVVELTGLDLRAIHAEHPGELAGVGGEHRGAPQWWLEVTQGVGVDHERYVVVERLLEGARCPVAAAAADHPGLHPARADDLGVRLPDPVAHLVVADVADHAAQARRCTGHAEQRRSRIGARPGADADHAPGVLLGVLGRAG